MRPSAVAPLRSFHHKVLRAILKLSPYSPVTPLYFLLGEIPIEASLHIGVLFLFWNIWSNPKTKAFEVLKYLLAMSGPNSLTWSAHVRLLFQLYSLPDPLTLLSMTPWPKQRWKDYTNVAVTTYHESVLRQRSSNNMKLQFLNVKAIGLLGKPHPVVAWANTTQDVASVRPHVKMLAGDYLCYHYLAHDRGIEPYCPLCKGLSGPHPSEQPPIEDMVHVLTLCKGTKDTREGQIPDLLNTVAHYIPDNLLLSTPTHQQFTQFLLDCTSLNLPTNLRIPSNHPGFLDITRQCSKMIFAIHRHRMKQLSSLGCIAK